MDKQLFLMHEFLNKHEWTKLIASASTGLTIKQCKCGAFVYKSSSVDHKVQASWIGQFDTYNGWTFVIPFDVFQEEVRQCLLWLG